MREIIPMVALIVSLCSLLISFDVWRRSFRPVVSAAVKTHAAGNVTICYDLVIQNSGTRPARNIRISPVSSLDAALGQDATEDNKRRWLACFDQTIPVLQPNERVSCSFGTTQINDAGFWKHKAIIRIRLSYEEWLGGLIRRYPEEQDIQIVSSESFTGFSWGDAPLP
jgi:hypothetical protein